MITEHNLIEAIAEALRSGFTGVKMTRGLRRGLW